MVSQTEQDLIISSSEHQTKININQNKSTIVPIENDQIDSIDDTNIDSGEINPIAINNVDNSMFSEEEDQDPIAEIVNQIIREALLL